MDDAFFRSLIEKRTYFLEKFFCFSGILFGQHTKVLFYGLFKLAPYLLIARMPFCVNAHPFYGSTTICHTVTPS